MSQIIAKLTLTVTVLQLVRAGHGLSVNQVFGGYLGRGSEDTSTSEGETQVREDRAVVAPDNSCAGRLCPSILRDWAVHV